MAVKQYHDCMEVREEFSAYLDGELATEEREGIEAHLAGCAQCLRELDTMKRVDVAYRGLSAVAAPDGFEANVREAVRTGRTGSEPVRRPVPRWMGPLVAMATAAAVLIVSVIVFEVRQGSAPEMQVASVPMTLESADSAALMQTAPAASAAPHTASAADQGAAGGGDAWDGFARAPEAIAEPEAKSKDASAKEEGAWENFARVPADPAPSPAADTALGAGREDSASALTDNLAVAGAESDSNEGLAQEMRARADVIGAPPADAPAEAPARAEAVPAPASPEITAGVGEVVSRRVLRSFKVRADGAWVESGYAGEPATELKRGSDALNQVMRQHPNETWDTMLDRTAVQIFQLDGVWYALEGKPAEQ